MVAHYVTSSDHNRPSEVAKDIRVGLKAEVLLRWRRDLKQKWHARKLFRVENHHPLVMKEMLTFSEN